MIAVRPYFRREIWMIALFSFHSRWSFQSCSGLLIISDKRSSFLKQIVRPDLDYLRRKNLHKKIVAACKKVQLCPHCGFKNGTFSSYSLIFFMEPEVVELYIVYFLRRLIAAMLLYLKIELTCIQRLLITWLRCIKNNVTINRSGKKGGRSGVEDRSRQRDRYELDDARRFRLRHRVQ